MPPSLLERYQGTLVGVLAGDALCAPYENQEPIRIAEDLERRGGLVPFDYDDPWDVRGHIGAGTPTDDSELTGALAQSLIDCGTSDPHDQYTLFKRAVKGKSYLWDGPTGSFGRTTRRMLKAANYGRALLRENRPNIPTNGSLMRSAPLALYLHRGGHSLQAHEEIVRASAAVTHLHEVAIECTLLYCYLLECLLSGIDIGTAWAEACLGSSHSVEMEQAFIVNYFPEPEATNRWLHQGGKAGTALHTLHIAVWSAMHAIDFRDGMQMAVRFGGDTDTQAAVAGSLLGAMFGLEGIPQEWRNVLKGGERMERLAYELYHFSLSSAFT
jgi:ADP-ribosyl-[dinitrogen reductase] hydrolase